MIERAVILSTDGTLRVSFMDSLPAAPRGTGTLNRLTALERDAILSALRDTGGVVAGPNGAAARLGVKRTTLQSRMRALGIRRS